MIYPSAHRMSYPSKVQEPTVTVTIYCGQQGSSEIQSWCQHLRHPSPLSREFIGMKSNHWTRTRLTLFFFVSFFEFFPVFTFPEGSKSFSSTKNSFADLLFSSLAKAARAFSNKPARSLALWRCVCKVVRGWTLKRYATFTALGASESMSASLLRNSIHVISDENISLETAPSNGIWKEISISEAKIY